MACSFFSSMVLTLLLTPSTLWAQATFDQKNVDCYQIKIPDTPDNHKKSHQNETQVWCYHQGQKDSDKLFIFNADQPKVKAELSLLVDQDLTITHASLLAGEITYHKVKGDEYNPFSIPLKEPQNLKPITTPPISKKSAEDVMNSFARNSYQKIQEFKIQQGEFSAFVQAHALPWRGFWWPYKSGRLYKDSVSSPLGKYDRFVAARSGSSPGARLWEASHHTYGGVWWEGHCNGWAASAILRREPKFSKRDPRSGVTFSVGDQKGLLAETDYCAATSFFGKRYRGRAGDNRGDIAPDLFHKTITYYIGNLGKPVIMDYRSDSAVDNHPVSAYSFNIVKTSTGFDVTAHLTFHKYDARTNHPPGIAPPYTRTYRYSLREDSLGRITGGTWYSNNPDFIWVPLAIQDCDRNNPQLSHEVISEILSLPSAYGGGFDIF